MLYVGTIPMLSHREPREVFGAYRVSYPLALGVGGQLGGLPSSGGRGSRKKAVQGDRGGCHDAAASVMAHRARKRLS
jgi:hypothetical protein